MSVRDVLAVNFKKLREATPSLNLPRDIVRAGAATNGTIGRIANKENGPSIDTIEALAAAYGLEAWQMLSPTLEVQTGTSTKPITSGADGWPFPGIDPARWAKMTKEQRIEIQGVVRDRIEKFEAAPGTASPGQIALDILNKSSLSARKTPQHKGKGRNAA